jgi:hypothetical protein
MLTFLKLGDLGRLGNQLFQIAATVAAARRSNASAVFPQFESEEWLGVETRSLVELEREDWKTFRPVSFAYDPNVRNISSTANVNLEGYFQSERYFDDCTDIIRALIMTDAMNAIATRVKREYKIPSDNNYCAVHVRRGDYVKFPERHKPLSFADYYRPAMEFMKHRHGVERFVVVSDDQKVVREELKGQAVMYGHTTGTILHRIRLSLAHRAHAAYSPPPQWAMRLRRYENYRALHDLMLMSNCRHHIISNSSFSWWSSWLSPFSERVVVAPKVWFGPALPYDTSDLYRSDMVIL